MKTIIISLFLIISTNLNAMKNPYKMNLNVNKKMVLYVNYFIAQELKGMDKKAISALWKEVKLSEIQKLVSELS